MSQRGKCPKCGQEIQFPDNMDRVICMYCGKPVLAEELIQITFTDEEKEEIASYETALAGAAAPEERRPLIEKLFELDSNNQQAHYYYALDHIHQLFTHHQDLMSKFKENSYEEAFEDYMEAEREVVMHVELACNRLPEEEVEERLEKIASALMDAIVECIEARAGTGRNKKDLVRNDVKMHQVVYLVPMIRELRLDISEEFCDNIIHQWTLRYPKDVYYKGDYHHIITGFRQRKVCYITTAVCDTFGKPDNCYELMRFRQFRDDYLMEQPGGREMVEEYYEVAPAIVANIDMHPEREEIYTGIWNEYLKPCLDDIEAGRNEGCRQRYTEMVRTLEKRYH